MAAVIPPATFVVHCTNAQETLNFLAAEMEALSCGDIESSGYVQAELHVVVIKEHVLLMIYITARSIT